MKNYKMKTVDDMWVEKMWPPASHSPPLMKKHNTNTLEERQLTTS